MEAVGHLNTWRRASRVQLERYILIDVWQCLRSIHLKFKEHMEMSLKDETRGYNRRWIWEEYLRSKMVWHDQLRIHHQLIMTWHNISSMFSPWPSPPITQLPRITWCEGEKDFPTFHCQFLRFCFPWRQAWRQFVMDLWLLFCFQKKVQFFDLQKRIMWRWCQKSSG